MVGLYIGLGIGAVALVVIAVLIWRAVKAKKLKALQIAIATEHLERIQGICGTFSAAIQSLKTQGYVCGSQIKAIQEEWKPTYQEFKQLHYYGGTDTNRLVNSFKQTYGNLNNIFSKWNAEFVASEKKRQSVLLANIDGKSLDSQQQDVVVSAEDNTLVLAGAGSGKTLTIAGKVKYLCEVKKVEPGEILLIAFTRKSAEEMTERISKRHGIPITATTFHKLGLDILKKARNESLDVLEDASKYVNQYFENELLKRPEIVKLLLEYFAYYLHIPADMENFDSLGEAYAYEKGMDFETIKSKFDRTQLVDSSVAESREQKHTLRGEQVKSLEEVSIANYLFLNGVRYEYESKYPHQTNDANFKVYRPDFYLPDYDIFIEHFGVNKNGKLPWLSDIEEKKYLEGMAWKRQQHRTNGTKLLETYSYYSSQGVLLEKLEALLRQNGVKLKEVDYREVFDSIYKTQSDAYFSEFKKLCGTFLALFKSNAYRIAELEELREKKSRHLNSYFQRRIELFVLLVKPLLEAYDRYLEENHMIDFSDMINMASEAIRTGFKVAPYKYVLIDEYQDISVARYKLVKAILDQTHAKLLCVGDDWQSIYRFAGSDISLFTDFNKYYSGKASVMKLERTYRNSQELINVAGAFIQMNPRQMQKNLVSSKHINQPITFWMYDDNPFRALDKAITELVNNYEGKSILLLGRTAYDSEMLDASGLFYERRSKASERYVYKKSPNTPISFLTVHRAKGLEADNVILLNFQNSTLGFPNKISDDPMLELVLSNADNYLFGEERRLFYVAMTRTKNRFIVLTDNNKPSIFFEDLKNNPNITIEIGECSKITTVVDCPRCKTGRLVVRKNEERNRYFLGCSNYPQCDYTVNDTAVLEKPRKCRVCGGFMVERSGRFGKFYGCSNYPTCQHTEEINSSPSSGQSRKIGY